MIPDPWNSHASCVFDLFLFGTIKEENLIYFRVFPHFFEFYYQILKHTYDIINLTLPPEVYFEWSGPCSAMTIFLSFSQKPI